ncbi:MAG: sterol desaturase family protein [Bacteroidia bacterium]|nr:sterol desaturase family protein [Bacteroidia bacterium]
MDKAPNYIAMAIPVFFLLIGVEVLVQKLAKSKLYRFNDAVNNISCGVTSQVFGALVRTVFIVGYLYLYDNFRLLEIPQTWWAWTLCFVGVDFFYYWFHRYSHELAVMWGAHIVHHQSEEYNLSVALRQSAFQPFFSSLFYLPLALIGFSPFMFVVVNQFQTLYQFWIHTRAIGKLPWIIELIFNTPSHHRVHHGRNPKYIDRNHGGTLIIFDRMFGTFQAEEEEVVYGITTPLSSWNPVWANFHYYKELLGDMSHMRRIWDRFRAWFMPPGWLPKEMGGQRKVPEVTVEKVQKYDRHAPGSVNPYIFFQYVLIIGVTTAFLFLGEAFGLWPKLAMAALIFWGVINLGAIFDRKSWALASEIVRLPVLAASVPLLPMLHPEYQPEWLLTSTLIGAGLLAVSLTWLLAILPRLRAKEVAG